MNTSYLCDGKVQTDVDDDCKEKYVESSYNQQRLLQHQDLIEIIMNLETQTKKFLNSGLKTFSQFMSNLQTCDMNLMTRSF